MREWMGCPKERKKKEIKCERNKKWVEGKKRNGWRNKILTVGNWDPWERKYVYHYNHKIFSYLTQQLTPHTQCPVHKTLFAAFLDTPRYLYMPKSAHPLLLSPVSFESVIRFHFCLFFSFNYLLCERKIFYLLVFLIFF